MEVNPSPRAPLDPKGKGDLWERSIETSLSWEILIFSTGCSEPFPASLDTRVNRSPNLKDFSFVQLHVSLGSCQSGSLGSVLKSPSFCTQDAEPRARSEGTPNSPHAEDKGVWTWLVCRWEMSWETNTCLEFQVERKARKKCKKTYPLCSQIMIL